MKKQIKWTNKLLGARELYRSECGEYLIDGVALLHISCVKQPVAITESRTPPCKAQLAQTPEPGPVSLILSPEIEIVQRILRGRREVLSLPLDGWWLHVDRQWFWTLAGAEFVLRAGPDDRSPISIYQGDDRVGLLMPVAIGIPDEFYTKVNAAR